MLKKPNSNLYSQSTNIIRDADRELCYYPTDNSKRIFHQVINDFKLGVHSFNIIGSYGTGKSSFLWALEKNLLKGQPYFAENPFKNRKVEILKFVGSYSSIIKTFKELFECDESDASNELFSKIYYEFKLSIQKGLFVILIDEFGKFLEFAAEHSPEKELYFLQELAEFVNNPKYNIIFLSTVHQNFDAYAFGLNNIQRQEWGKVKGRFKELTFNEPIEQLLKLAADHFRAHSGRKSADDDVMAMQMADLFKKSKVFELTADISSDIALDLLPLDLIAANVLTISLQRYGQNERSLFSFLESSDHTSLSKVTRGNRVFNLAHVYDYLIFNFYSFIQSKYNPDYATWKAIRNALDEVERMFEKQTEDCAKIIKSIGLLQLTATQGSELDTEFIGKYARLCLNISNGEVLIDKLKSKNLIIYREHLHRYVLNEGTSLDVEAALIRAAAKVERVNDVATLLKRYYSLPPVLAKSYTYETGTPRVFEFVITDKLSVDKPIGEIDGFIYLIFNEKLKIDNVIEYSSALNAQPVVFVYYENSKSIKDLLFELEKLRKVKEENNEDKVAVRLLNESLEAGQRALNHFILGGLHSNAQHLKWVWNGKVQNVHNKRSFNQLLSVACEAAYPHTPTFNNELLNKHKISHSIGAARKNYFKALAAHWDSPDLGFDKEKFPPEKTIYLSLLKENHISVALGIIDLQNDLNNIGHLWNASCLFLEQSKERRKSIVQFVEILSERPFKLKQGLISFWIPSFLFIKRDEFALFGPHGYVPFLSDETLELIIRYPDRYEIKAFDLDEIRLILFNQYRAFLQQTEKDAFDNQTFIDTIRPFFTFYKQLPDFTKYTKKNLSPAALALREVIGNTEDLERIFFEDFPGALGYSIKQLSEKPEQIEEYVVKLEATIKEIRTCFESLVNRFDGFIQDRIIGEQLSFEFYKSKLIKRYESLKQHLTDTNQKIFIQRLTSEIADRRSWINSISQALVGKPLEAFNDEDESILKDRFLAMTASLDNLIELVETGYDMQIEDVLRFEINSFLDGVNKTIVRLPKSKRAELAHVENKIRKIMTGSGSDNQLHIVALANLIKELMQP